MRPLIKSALKSGKFDLVISLIQSGEIDPSFDDNFLIKFCSKKGYAELVKECLKHEVNPSVQNNYAIREACRNGYADIVKMLLEYSPPLSHLDWLVDPNVDDNYCICVASKLRRKDVVRIFNVGICREDSYGIGKNKIGEIDRYS